MIYGVNSFNYYNLFQVQKLIWPSEYQYNVKAQMFLILNNPSIQIFNTNLKKKIDAH